MRQLIRRIMDGQFSQVRSTLDLSTTRIELSIREGESSQGSFFLSTRTGEVVRGGVYSSSLRMNILTGLFEGDRAEIFYSFNGEGMEEGDIEKGEIFIVSPAGEYSIPFSVCVEHGVISSSRGPIKNLFHFANLARSNFQEAVSLFYSSSFSSVFHGNDLKYLGTYRGLSRIRGNEQNVDEFLIAINKKQRIEYIPMEERIRIEDPYGVEEGRVTLTRNGWGYTALCVETQGEFLTTEKKVLTDDNFLGNLCTFSYQVDASRLHAGNNYGDIHIFGNGVSIHIPVLATRPLSRHLHRSVRREKMELNTHLMDYYVAFRMRQISADLWLKETRSIVEKMNSLDEKDLGARMFLAQLLITEDRSNEAGWILDQLKKELNYEDRKPEEWCYYLYLTSLLNRDDRYVDQVTDEVEEIYAREPENWRIAWLLLYLREELSRSPYKKWMFLEQQFYGGCVSPVLYAEALTLLYANPTLLMKLSEYELQILSFAAKKGYLRRDIILQLHALAARVHTYHPRLLFILEKSYKSAEDDETLAHICAMYIKGNRTDEVAYGWYSLGVERELRVTNLFEYFMMSLPDNYNRPLPRMVEMYFAYHSQLPYERMAKLYANIYRYRDSYPEWTETYMPLMEEFILTQIREGHVSLDLAYLYKELLTPIMLTDEIREALVPILFSQLIRVPDEKVKQVVLIYDKLKGELTYPVINQIAIVPIYSAEHTLLLQDALGGRYKGGDEMEITNLMLPGRFVKLMGESVAHIGLDLYRIGNSQVSMSINTANVNSYQRLWKSERITDSFRSELRLRLAKFYYENDMITETDEILETLRPAAMGEKERTGFLQLLISRGMYDKAYEWLSLYGEGQCDIGVLVRLVSRLIVRMEYKSDDTLLSLAYAIFRKKKYDENILRYLISYYQGTTRALRDLWKAGLDFELELNGLCERILLQYMYTGYYIGEKNELFYYYVRHGAKRDVEIAFLTGEAYGYFVNDQILDKDLIPYYTRLFYRGEDLQEVCRLTYLKYHAENANLPEETLQLCTRFLSEFLGRGIYFPFFRHYGKVLPDITTILDRTMVEYHAPKDAKVLIHYVTQKSNGESEYITEPMKRMYEGIYVHSFVLFFGETLQYYITEEKDGEEQLTQSESVSKNDTDAVTPDSRYAILNDMMVAATLEDYETFSHLYGEYDERCYMMSRLFPAL